MTCNLLLGYFRFVHIPFYFQKRDFLSLIFLIHFDNFIYLSYIRSL